MKMMTLIQGKPREAEIKGKKSLRFNKGTFILDNSLDFFRKYLENSRHTYLSHTSSTIISSIALLNPLLTIS